MFVMETNKVLLPQNSFFMFDFVSFFRLRNQLSTRESISSRGLALSYNAEHCSSPFSPCLKFSYCLDGSAYLLFTIQKKKTNLLSLMAVFSRANNWKDRKTGKQKNRSMHKKHKETDSEKSWQSRKWKNVSNKNNEQHKNIWTKNQRNRKTKFQKKTNTRKLNKKQKKNRKM